MSQYIHVHLVWGIKKAQRDCICHVGLGGLNGFRVPSPWLPAILQHSRRTPVENLLATPC